MQIRAFGAGLSDGPAISGGRRAVWAGLRYARSHASGWAASRIATLTLQSAWRPLLCEGFFVGVAGPRDGALTVPYSVVDVAGSGYG